MVIFDLKWSFSTEMVIFDLKRHFWLEIAIYDNGHFLEKGHLGPELVILGLKTSFLTKNLENTCATNFVF